MYRNNTKSIPLRMRIEFQKNGLGPLPGANKMSITFSRRLSRVWWTNAQRILKLSRTPTTSSRAPICSLQSHARSFAIDRLPRPFPVRFFAIKTEISEVEYHALSGAVLDAVLVRNEIDYLSMIQFQGRCLLFAGTSGDVGGRDSRDGS